MEERSTLRIPSLQLQQAQPAAIRPAPAAPLSPGTPRPVPQQSPSYDVQSPVRPQAPAPAQVPVVPPVVRQPGPPGRQQRSLNDLRGIRSMGRRQDTRRGRQTGEEDEQEEAIDVPPFMKKFD